jgi:hypothetical protein
MPGISWQLGRGWSWVPAALVLVAAGCGKVAVDGTYRDAGLPEVVYEFRPDATWTAKMEKKVPLGLLPHGSGRKLTGVYRLQGSTLELTCRSVEERDPVSGDYRAVRIIDGDDESLLRGYDHEFTVEGGTLRALGEGYPFGSGELVPVEAAE